MVGSRSLYFIVTYAQEVSMSSCITEAVLKMFGRIVYLLSQLNGMSCTCVNKIFRG